MAIIPSYTGRNFFSASIQNEWTNLLLEYYGLSQHIQPAFVHGEDVFNYPGTGTDQWTGYFFYTGITDTFRYAFTNGGGSATTEIYINDIEIARETTNGLHEDTVDLSTVVGLTLTANTVYQIRVWGENRGATATGEIHWLGLEYDPTYTAPPTFTNGSTYTIANSDDIRDGIIEIQDIVEMPVTGFGMEESEADHSNDDEQTRWIGSIIYTHDTLFYRMVIDSSTGGNLRWHIYVNGTEAATDTTDGTIEDTADLSSLSLTAGTRYKVEITINRVGTGSTVNLDLDVEMIGLESTDNPPTVTIWSHGDQTVGATGLNKYATLINDIHPGASSPDMPFYWRQPVVRVPSTNKFRIRKLRRYLRYRWDGNQAPELTYGSNTTTLTSATGNQRYDLKQESSLSRGQWYEVDDVDYCQETDI